MTWNLFCSFQRVQHVQPPCATGLRGCVWRRIASILVIGLPHADCSAISRRAVTLKFAPLWQRCRIIARCGLGLHLPQAPQTGCIYLRPYYGVGTSPRANAARESISLVPGQRLRTLRKARRYGPPIALDFCFG